MIFVIIINILKIDNDIVNNYMPELHKLKYLEKITTYVQFNFKFIFLFWIISYYIFL